MLLLFVLVGMRWDEVRNVVESVVRRLEVWGVCQEGAVALTAGHTLVAL